MKAVRLYGPRDLRVEEIAAPVFPLGQDVLVRVTAAGICGSDIHNFVTGQWISRAPTTPGHELTGIAEAVGPDAAPFRIGDHVIADSRVWCGRCAACLAGRRHLCETLGFVGEVCDGGFAEAVVLPARLLRKVDAALDARVAAMAEPLAVALHAVARLRPRPGDPVLVVGCGTIGGLVALVLSRSHEGPVLVTDRNPDRMELVSRVTGAIGVSLDRQAIQAATGEMAVLHAVDATGSVPALRAAMEIIDAGATLALVGIFHARLDFDPNWLVEKEIALLGCHAFGEELDEAIGLLPALSPALLAMMGSAIGLDEVPAAYERLMAGSVVGLKIIVLP